MHHDAELAVIGIGIVRVLVRYLGYDQQRQKDKAHDRNCRQNATPDAALLAEICLKSCQSMVSAVSLFILQNYAIYWTPKALKGLQGFWAANAGSLDSSKLCCHG